jgi:hypothetical protein
VRLEMKRFQTRLHDTVVAKDGMVQERFGP